jgi:predicted nucleotidyltransferase component of viral defense system
MISLEEILSYFPKHLQQRSYDAVREYLQCKILEIIFKSKVGYKLVFIGGTALRLIHNTQRFSEDLDFDNKNLTMKDWEYLGLELSKSLNKLGYKIDIDTKCSKNVFHHDIKFENLLHELNISPHPNTKLLIKVDSQDQGVDYQASTAILSKFDTFTEVRVAAPDILLSMKLKALMSREMGRDLYDISFIAAKTKPNYSFLEETLDIKNPQELKTKLLKRLKDIDIERLKTRTQKFLFNSDDIKRITCFKDFVKQWE